MIYLNQAATTWPKPEIVKEAVQAAIALPPFSQNRSSSVENRREISKLCREKLSELFNIEDADRIYFTSGATDSFNRIVRGLDLEGKKVLISANEHNGVVRPLYNIYKNIDIAIAECDENGDLQYEQFEKLITSDTKAVFVNHCSNVTGAAVDLKRIAQMAHSKGALLVADVSQSAGHIEVDVLNQGVDILVFTGHKGLFGPQGTGGFYIKQDIGVKPVVYGGTGYDSKRIIMEETNAEYEVGTQNLHGIAGLCAGVEFVLQQGIDKIHYQEELLIRHLREGLMKMNNVKVYGSSERNGPVLSFNIRGLDCADVAFILANSYEITVRSGFHCAPLIHNALGSDKNGTVRVSVSCFNTMEEIDEFLQVTNDIASGVA